MRSAGVRSAATTAPLPASVMAVRGPWTTAGPLPSRYIAISLHTHVLHARARARVSAKGGKEMSVEKGDVLVVLKKASDGWWRVRNKRGQVGLVPGNRFYPDAVPVAIASQ